MKKYFYNFYLIIKNINNYGIITFFYAAIIEMFYLLRFYDFESYIHDDTETSTYQETKNKAKYDGQHTPTPYFFLTIASKFIKQINYDDFILIDMGCGYGRVGKFFLSKYNSIFYGLEINQKLLNNLDNYTKKNSKFKIFQIDLRDVEKRSKIFDEIKKKNKKIVIFLSDPFDIDTILDILSYFEKNEHIIVGVNIDSLQKLFIKYEIKYKKNFDKLRHVVLLTKK